MNEGPAARPHPESSPSNSSSCATSSVAASPSGNCSFSAFFFPFGASVNCSQSRLWRRKEPFSTTIRPSFLPLWPRRGNLRPLFIVSSLSTSQRSGEVPSEILLPPSSSEEGALSHEMSPLRYECSEGGIAAAAPH